MKEYLPAIKTLEDYYSNFKWWQRPRGLHPCPLCVTARHRGVVLCHRCPWAKIEGLNCAPSDFTNDRTYKRLKRLKRWRKQIERPDTVQIEYDDLIVTVNAENHAGYWEVLKARLFGKKVKTAETTVIKYKGRYYLTDYKEGA